MRTKEVNKQRGNESHLTGLRGLAALAVLFHHISLTLPWFSDRSNYSPLDKSTHRWSVHFLLEYTPLHLLYGGSEAVLIFFVISGYVLAKSLQNKSILGYLVSRFMRLYIPIWGALMFSTFLLLLVSRQGNPSFSGWINTHAMTFHWPAFAKDFYVLDGVSQLDSSLWSMKYEIIFSVLIIVFADSIKRFQNVSLRVSFTAIIILELFAIHFHLDLMKYFCYFFAGMLIQQKARSRYHVTITMISMIFLASPWILIGLGVKSKLFLAQGLVLIGATLLVRSAIVEGSSFNFILNNKYISSLGNRAFSLYLIHAPILISVWFFTGPTMSHKLWILRTTSSLFLIVIVVEIFYRFVEKPSHNLARKLSLKLSTQD
jgi:peptidoglycan/LPS O-acetylase OafA/YrhL